MKRPSEKREVASEVSCQKLTERGNLSSGDRVGFDLLRAAQNLKLSFHEAGYKGRVSFVQACIASGMVWDHTIVRAAVAIAGQHIEEDIAFLIEEGENEHWRRNSNGELYVPAA